MLDNRKLPIGIQDFEDLRKNNYVYVDKTAYLYRLVTMGKPFFLGRPRRFGKSLFLSKLKAYFLGKKKLFEGLAIAELEKDWIEYPVIYIDLNKSTYENVKTLNNVLDYILSEYEEKWNIKNKSKELSIRFDKLIQCAEKQTGCKVVVLVDEYDKPLLGTMDKGTINNKIQDALKGFYGILKSADAHLRFVFLTGVTKFSKVSVFSDLNHLKDISMTEQYAGICGISETELVRDFKPEWQALAEKRGETFEEVFAEMKKRYDGYHFAKKSEDIYNPFSVLNTFCDLDFGNYWFETGTPTFLVKMLKKIDFDIKTLKNDVRIAEDSIRKYRGDSKNPIPLLYQSGYLTIKDYDPLFNEYILGFPNEEVAYGFFNELLLIYMPDKNILTEFHIASFVRDLLAGNVDAFMNRLKAFFGGISYELENKKEKHFQTIFYILFTLMGQFVDVEARSATGRADAVVKTANTIFVFEFKLTENATAEKAIKQIDNNNYLVPYTAENKKLVKIGVEFSIEERGIKQWSYEL
jgi:hypothetical protein